MTVDFWVIWRVEMVWKKGKIYGVDFEPKGLEFGCDRMMMNGCNGIGTMLLIILAPP